MDELKFHFRQLVPVIFTLLDGEKHVAAASVNVVDSSTEKLNTASARGLAMRCDVGGRRDGTGGCRGVQEAPWGCKGQTMGSQRPGSWEPNTSLVRDV